MDVPTNTITSLTLLLNKENVMWLQVNTSDGNLLIIIYVHKFLHIICNIYTYIYVYVCKGAHRKNSSSETKKKKTKSNDIDKLLMSLNAIASVVLPLKRKKENQI